MTKPAHFFFSLAGDRLSDMFAGYGLRTYQYQPIEEIEYELDSTKEGHKDFDSCEMEAKQAMRETGSPFAIVFQGSKIYGYISKDKTATHEVIS